MKQHITAEQLRELNPTQMVRIQKEWRANGQHVNLLNHTDINIGTMIEFLQKNTNTSLSILENKFIDSKRMEVDHFVVRNVYIAYNVNLCDALWEDVKEVLGNFTNPQTKSRV